MRKVYAFGVLGVLLVGAATFALTRPSSEVRVSYRASDRESYIEAVGDKYKCELACKKGASTPYCRAIPLTAQYTTGLRTLSRRLASGATVIPQSQIMADFGAQTDPCNRSDTSLVGGKWTNTGTACLLSANVDIFGDGKPVKFEVALPSDVAFVPSADQQGRHYKSDRGPPSLRIDDQDLHNDWGGGLAEVIDGPNGILLQLPRGCLKLGDK